MRSQIGVLIPELGIWRWGPESGAAYYYFFAQAESSVVLGTRLPALTDNHEEYGHACSILRRQVKCLVPAKSVPWSLPNTAAQYASS